MGKRPRLLDLFCCEGGASMGYYRAGFDVEGVDSVPQPRYPFPFHLADALEYLRDHWGEFDAIHASPPCQRWAPCTPDPSIHPDLLNPTVSLVEELFVRYGIPYVVENVPTSPLRRDVILCGTMFDLRVIRHRVFRSSALLMGMEHSCRGKVRVVRQGSVATSPDEYMTVTGKGGKVLSLRSWLYNAARCMGIDWMDGPGLVQAIPPAYTEYVGKQLILTC